MVILVLILLGLCFGSFINALVWRLRESRKVKNRTKKKALSITKGRSMCVHCHHVLAWYDLLPVLSWISLKGRCRYCNKPISFQYPIVELLTASLFILSYLVWPHSFDTLGIIIFVYWLAFLVGFVALIIYDLRWMLLPNKIVLPLTVLAGLQVCVEALLRKDVSVLVSAFWGCVIVGGLFYLLFQISDGKWIGGGDVKLGFVLGLLSGGAIQGFLVIFLASLLGTVVTLPLMGFQKKTLSKRIPFGPFLIVATIVIYLFGAILISWFEERILLV